MSWALITDLTIEVKPGKNECLYQFVRAKTTFEVEYQVGLIVNLGYYRSVLSSSSFFFIVRHSFTIEDLVSAPNLKLGCAVILRGCASDYK